MPCFYGVLARLLATNPSASDKASSDRRKRRCHRQAQFEFAPSREATGAANSPLRPGCVKTTKTFFGSAGMLLAQSGGVVASTKSSTTRIDRPHRLRKPAGWLPP